MTINISSLRMPEINKIGKFARTAPKYPLSDLRPNSEDCIILEGDIKKERAKLSAAVVNYLKKGNQGQFKVRTFVVDGVQKVGVWRTA